MANDGVIEGRRYSSAVLRLSVIVGIAVVIVGSFVSSDPTRTAGVAIVTAAFSAAMFALLLRFIERPFQSQLRRVPSDQLPRPASMVQALTKATAIIVILYGALLGFYIAWGPNSAVLLGICLANPVTALRQLRRYDRLEHDHHATAYVTTRAIWTSSQARTSVIWLVPQTDAKTAT